MVSVSALAWGSSVKYRHRKFTFKFQKGAALLYLCGCSKAALHILEDHMNLTVEYCGILHLLRQLIDAGAFTYPEAKRIAARIAQGIGVEPLISL